MLGNKRWKDSSCCQLTDQRWENPTDWRLNYNYIKVDELVLSSGFNEEISHVCPGNRPCSSVLGLIQRKNSRKRTCFVQFCFSWNSKSILVKYFLDKIAMLAVNHISFAHFLLGLSPFSLSTKWARNKKSVCEREKERSFLPVFGFLERLGEWVVLDLQPCDLQCKQWIEITTKPRFFWF